MIGAGASGFQIAPAIADEVGQLTVCNAPRSGCSPTPTTTTRRPGVQWAMRHLPFYGRWYRFLLFWPGCDKGLAAAIVDPDWPGPADSPSATANDLATDDVHPVDHQPGRRRSRPAGQGDARLSGHRQTHPAGQRQLAAHADPRQRRTGPHAHRRGSNPMRVVTVDGVRHPPTSSSTRPDSGVNDMLSSLKVLGRNGIDLHEQVGSTPVRLPRHHGSGFPNFFCLYGPGTNLAHRRQPDLPLRVRDALHHGQCLDLLIAGDSRRWSRRRGPLRRLVRRAARPN